MDFHQLYYFKAIAESKTMSEAAESFIFRNLLFHAPFAKLKKKRVCNFLTAKAER